MPTFKTIRLIIGTLALFVAYQAYQSHISSRSGPFAFFAKETGTYDFASANKFIDKYFSQTRSIKESLSYMRNAQFECNHRENTNGKPLVSYTTADSKTVLIDPNEGPGSKIYCLYEFGAWLPLPKTWTVTIVFDGSGKSKFILPQRLRSGLDI